MRIREFVNERALLIGPAVIVVAIVLVFVIAKSMRGDTLPGPITRGFYSDDDGKTYFEDDVDKVYPFSHDGKQAYRAYVFRCGSGAPFVGFLGNSHGGETKKPDDPKGVAPAGADASAIAKSRASGPQVKKPGDAKWILLMSAKGSEIVSVRCPDGATPEVVLPAE